MDPRILRRRTFLQLAGAGALTISVRGLPGCGGSGSTAGARRFFTAEQRGTCEALAAALVPEDETVGALGAGVVEYLDRFLSAFDHAVPDLYRAGPFSGRWPYPDPKTGDASDHFPENGFREVLPPTRLQEMAFRIEILGSSSVENGNINVPLVPSTPGLQALYRDGLAQLEDIARARGQASFQELSESERLDAFDQTPRAFRDAVLDHVCEGLFCAPEYGGNTNGIAWRDYHYDGDSQPLGHTLHDPHSGEPRDRPDQPNQTLDPNLPNDGFPPDLETLLTLISVVQGGKRFF